MPTRFHTISFLLLFCASPAAAQDIPAKPATTAPVVDKSAPSFRLNDHLGKMVKVGGSSKHWTVLAFYPKAMTPG